MKKKLVSLAVVAGLVLSLCACGNGGANADSVGDATAKAELDKAVEGLNNLNQTYIISNTIQSPQEYSSYIEVVGDGFNYTEYPVDADGNVITDASADEGSSYMLSDWMTTDKFYTYAVNDSDEAGFYTLPDSYMQECKDRTNLYSSIIMSGISDVKKTDEPIKSDLGDGEKEFQIYEGTVSSEAVTKLMKIGSYDLYKSLAETYTDNANVVKYGQYMQDELGFNLVFGDAKATFAVADGILRYYQLEVGGLGTRMYISKSIVMSQTDVRDTPDFSDAKDYVTLIQNVADYVSKFDSYEDALSASGSETTTEIGTSEKNSEVSTEVSTEGTTDVSTDSDTTTEGTTDVLDETESTTE